ncbi:ferritin-like domain-containing protein [Beijerinckia indica]|uniref:Uncharacterized protein n=1 Tax=Beijerinckia indica subsp. indica (strain ATCC 9039 / DSM 1715 / NCIMB 8712) TaxID=395963 RepID=B2IHB7_BEII9|nr:DUF892 family protein [Beijerinckia indica]ACB95902.1 protein of unknown function DUF892 [Beijerinckia indica subsp. indica ATCC 9039]
MGFFSKDIQNMSDLFLYTLKDIYYAEKRITNTLPKMIDKAYDPELKSSFETHLSETEQQIIRLESIFRMCGVEAETETCPAIDGIIKETDNINSEIADQEVCDAALVAAAQAVEHYEITRYGTLVTWAKQLGRGDCANLLQQTLEEEKKTDAKLTQLAEAKLNIRAVG